MNRFWKLFDFMGTIGPAGYLGVGAVAMALKYAVDQRAAMWLNHSSWTPWNYLDPVGTSIQALAPNDHFLFFMSLIAIPFSWLGLSLTVKRLRSLGSPLWFITFFFIPLINLLFFILLSVIPKARETRERLSSPDNPRRDATLAILVSSAVCLAAVYVAATSSQYGWGVFAAAPFCIGLISSVIYSWNRPRNAWECMGVALSACAAVGVGLLCFAFEGLFCILMLAPFALTLGILGALVGYRMQPNLQTRPGAGAALAVLVLFPSLAIGSESRMSRAADEFVVTSAVEVNAPPEVVWKNVVTFSKLDEPTELMFKSGIAYPMRAEIEGQGVGAVRYCVFSTGPFVEPITVWDEPHMLEFSVSQVPPPMQELSPYPGLHPPHLDGFFISRKGHFLLTRLPGNRTRLEGTTWYRHNLWPEAYWQLWSDYIIHRIHIRVLEHVKRLSEADAGNL